MKILIKLKDGTTSSNDLGKDFRIVQQGQGNDFLSLLLKGAQNNSEITIKDESTGQEVKKHYSDLYSIELIFD